MMEEHLAIKNTNNYTMLIINMLSNLLDEEGQERVKNILGNATLPLKFYAIIITVVLLLNTFYLYSISKKLGN
jgi:hypothetical protein